MAQQGSILRFLTAAVVAGGVVVAPAVAQTRVGPDGTPPRRNPVLAGASDAAVSELKSVGFFDRQCVENIVGAADGGTACTPFFQLMRNGRTAISPLGSGLTWQWGVPPSERDTIAVPSLRNARGGGWSVIAQDQTGNDDLAAADGSLGLHHAGVTSTSDRTCRDHTNAFNAGQPLMAGSDCIDTWGAEGWKGARPIPQDVWAARYNANPGTFAFDFWRVTDAELDAAGIAPPSSTSPGKTIGNFQAYGYSSDHAAQTLCGTTTIRSYGNVIPATSQVVPGGCSGTPTRPGWPLGITSRTDAFSFQLPSLKEIMYYQTIFINNSQEVYGVGLDYDSLYINFGHGWYGGDQRQQQINYHDPSRGAWVIQTGPLVPCQVAREVVDLTCGGAWLGVGSTLGFNYGAAAMIALKSPIGDLRNKWFTRAGTPFYNPAHPLAGDTITYSHGHLCGFRACARNTYATDPNTTPDHEQRTFGMISSTEANTLGSRLATINTITPQVYWHTFRNYGFDGIRWAPGQNPALGGGWNTYVPPGNWDYNHDGVPDTLHLDGCHTNGCSAVWGDTLPNGKYGSYSNVASVMGVGPISLAAGDTVSFVVAVTTAQSDDSAGFEAQMSAAIDNYMNFYLTPDAAPKCRITGVTRTPPAEGLGIRVSWDASCMPGQWTDQFLVKQYNDLVAATPGTNPGLVRLRQLNPRLDDTLLFLSTNNMRVFYTFKSCNDGGTWTTGNDCVLGNPDPGSALGFVPFSIFEFDKNPGLVPTDFVDNNILAGRTYTYNVIGETRGANFTVMNGDSVYFNGTDTVCARGCRIENLALAPVLFNSLSASTGNANVARAYIPLSLQAGGSRSRAAVSLVSGPMGISRVGVTVTADSLANANYRVSFGDSARATQLEYRTGTNLDSVRTRVVLRMSAALGDSLVINGTNLGGFSVSGAAAVVTTPAPGVTQNSYTFGTGPVMALSRLPVSPADALLVSSTLTSTPAVNTTTPLTFRSNLDYPKFDLSVNSTLHLGANSGFDAQRFADASGTPIPPLVEPTVAWQIGTGLSQPDNTTSQNQSNGEYRITWGATPFGAGEPFRLDFSNPSGTAAAINAAISGRPAVSTGVVTDSAAATIQASTGAPTTFDSLVAVKLPFTVMNTSYNRPVLVAMRKRNTAGKTIMVGFGDDTIRVVAPNDAWVPGDTLIFIERQGQNGTGLQRVTFNRAVIGCDQAKFVRLSCNPVYPNTRGSPPLTTYLPAVSGQTNTFAYHTPITAASSFTIAATAPVSGTGLTGQPNAIRTGLGAVRVVPNPFIMLSQYGPNAERGQRLMFTHLPPRGIIRIYTVAGQFVQQITWDEANLGGNGDLTWNMRTREGNVLAAGLYIYVLTATDASGGTIASRTSKFVVIR